jgi:hypothetical protein
MKVLQEYCLCLINKQMMPTAIRVALVVGSLLFIINHGSAFLSGKMNGDRWLSVGLSYLVPYGVNIHGQFISRRRKS